MHEVDLTPLERERLVTEKATCPFLGSAIAMRELPVLNHPENPLARIQDVIALGNRGGGNLGHLLGLFAEGNHGKMPGAEGALDQPVYSGFFSLDLPGSQGSHAGHSGILQGDPAQIDSGRFSDADFDRLMSKSRGGFSGYPISPASLPRTSSVIQTQNPYRLRNGPEKWLTLPGSCCRA